MSPLLWVSVCADEKPPAPAYSVMCFRSAEGSVSATDPAHRPVCVSGLFLSVLSAQVCVGSVVQLRSAGHASVQSHVLPAVHTRQHISGEITCKAAFLIYDYDILVVHQYFGFACFLQLFEIQPEHYLHQLSYSKCLNLKKISMLRNTKFNYLTYTYL